MCCKGMRRYPFQHTSKLATVVYLKSRGKARRDRTHAVGRLETKGNGVLLPLFDSLAGKQPCAIGLNRPAACRVLQPKEICGGCGGGPCIKHRVAVNCLSARI